MIRINDVANLKGFSFKEGKGPFPGEWKDNLSSSERIKENYLSMGHKPNNQNENNSSYFVGSEAKLPYQKKFMAKEVSIDGKLVVEEI